MKKPPAPQRFVSRRIGGLPVGLLMLALSSVLCAFSRAELPTDVQEPLRGERYDLLVPDTLDLAERMKLSLNAITRCVAESTADRFPPNKYLANHFILLSAEYPRVLRNVNLYGKAMLGAQLARIATGSEERLEVDNNWRRSFLAWRSIDPTLHGPEGGRYLEWIAFNIRCEHGDARDAWTAIAQRAVRKMKSQIHARGEGAWIASGDGIIDEGFESIAQAREYGAKRAESFQQQLAGQPPRGWPATYMAWTVQGLCAIYRETGDNEALELAHKLARYLKDEAEIIDVDGHMLAGHEADRPVVHWHHSFLTAVACAEYGSASGDREFVAFADTAYQHALTQGSRQVGFAPEYCYGKYPRDQAVDDTEACCTSDLVHVALWLSSNGDHDYWDDVDRYVRNQLAALQMTDTRWFYELPENRGKWTYPNDEVEAHIGPLVGNFAGWATVNEWHVPELGCGIMTCCLGNCTRAMFYVWERMIECDGQSLTVHLLLNRASPWADIQSYLPYEGKVEIILRKELKTLSLRAPEWISSGSKDVEARRDGQLGAVHWQGRYMTLEGGPPGTAIILSFPNPTRTVNDTIGRQPFQLTIKGNTVAQVKPPGIRMPLYQRDQYLKHQVPLIRVERFVADDVHMRHHSALHDDSTSGITRDQVDKPGAPQ